MPWVDTLLRDANARLDVPLRARYDVLRELRGDVEALVARLVAEGVPPAQAEARALDLLHPGPEAMAALAEIHRPLSGRLALLLGQRAVDLLEGVGPLVMAGLAFSAPVSVLLGSGRLPFWAVAPLAVLGVGLVANPVREGLRWWLHRGARAPGLRLGVRVQVGGVLLALVWGGLATAWSGYRAAEGWAVEAPTPWEVVGHVAQALLLVGLALAVAVMGVFGAVALAQGLRVARGLEVELDELLREADSNDRR